MSKSSGSFISLPTIIFLVVMYNIIFDDDDEKDVEVKVTEEQADTRPVENDPDSSLSDTIEKAKEVLIQAKEVVIEAKDIVVEEYGGSDAEIAERTGEEVTQDVEVPPQEEVVISEEKTPDDGLDPLDETKDEDPLFKQL